MTSRYMERLAKIEEVLLIANKKIDINELRAGCSYGVPESLRPLAWRLLLHYLPLERHKWQTFLAEQRDNYDQMIEQIIVEPGTASLQQSAAQNQDNDHPLSDHPTSDWQAFFQDNKVLSQIDKDVRRLYPEIQFFQLLSRFPHQHGMKYPLSRRVINHQELHSQEFGANRDGIVGCVKTNIAKQSQDENQAPNSEFHWHIVERILFIYAKLNPGVQYVQGMNELVAPIYYVFANDADDEWAAYAEADTFFCFQQLMSEVKDNFIKKLDDSNCGIESSMSAFHNLISTFDTELHKHLTLTLEIKPQFYAFRWLSLLLSQEFPLPDVITLWDALFSDPQRFALLQYVCLAMMELKREPLINGDFPFCVRLLQNYPDTDIAKIVAFAQDIRDGKALRPIAKEISKGSKIARHARQLSDTLRNLSIIKK
ncbi:TBC1 domain family member 13 [Caenorhabditis elegans]|uniref:TBC1 domain family member 13 n=1 Tax=Caenorhabditis elegans TaxID=6239 RepID=Q20436_CAEEL|nr:Rab-GAP TBC domain-containing protein [Caenorhabditis elegans]CAA92181.3 Rab-GAP TBC domain-containing protein [Caenorhabditis elegans]